MSLSNFSISRPKQRVPILSLYPKKAKTKNPNPNPSFGFLRFDQDTPLLSRIWSKATQGTLLFLPPTFSFFLSSFLFFYFLSSLILSARLEFKLDWNPAGSFPNSMHPSHCFIQFLSFFLELNLESEFNLIWVIFIYLFFIWCCKLIWVVSDFVLFCLQY